jgi:hypothetical protein
MSHFKKFKIVFLQDGQTIEDKGMYIISCQYVDSLFSSFPYFSFTTTFNGFVFERFAPVDVYYDETLLMRGVIRKGRQTPFAKIQTFEVRPITYLLTIQGMKTDKEYQQENFITHVLDVIKDNFDGSRITQVGKYKGIKIDNYLEFGIIPPLNRNAINQMSEDTSNRKSKKGTKVFDYIEKLANQKQVHITTLIYQGETYLYFLDTADIVNKDILNNEIPIILSDILTDINAFTLEWNEDVIRDELYLFSEGSFDDFGDVGSSGKHTIDLNKIFKDTGLKNDTETLKGFFKNALAVKFRDFQQKESLMQNELIQTTAKFIAENTLATGLSVSVKIYSLKSSNNIDFLVGSYIDISELLINGNYTKNKVSAQSFVITGKSYNWSSSGFTQEISIGCSFLLEK